jgi:hypothetical protein
MWNSFLVPRHSRQPCPHGTSNISCATGPTRSSFHKPRQLISLHPSWLKNISHNVQKSQQHRIIPSSLLFVHIHLHSDNHSSHEHSLWCKALYFMLSSSSYCCSTLDLQISLIILPLIKNNVCFFVPPSCVLRFNLVSTNTQKTKNILSELTRPSHSVVWQNYMNVISFAELLMCNSGEFLNFCKTSWILTDTNNIVNDEAFQYLFLHKVETILQQDSRNIIYIY